jgi:hypothetical protein
MSTSDLTTLAWDLASDGFAGRDAAVRQVVVAARAAGVPAALVDTLADARRPEPVRLRAFGRIAAALAAINGAAAARSTRAA